MRPALLVTLFAIGLLTLGLHGRSNVHAVHFKVPAPPISENTKQPEHPKITVEGQWMTSHHEAVASALEAAQVAVVKYLRDQQPPLEWVPPIQFIETRLAREISPVESRDVEGVKMYRVRMEVVLDSVVMRYMEERNHEIVVQDRMLGLGKIVLALIAVLGVVALYLRLDERTKGYYTGWLRLIAVALIGAVGAGLLLLA